MKDNAELEFLARIGTETITAEYDGREPLPSSAAPGPVFGSSRMNNLPPRTNQSAAEKNDPIGRTVA